MSHIYESKNFIVESREKPHITRTDGGHLVIFPKREGIVDRQGLTTEEATELMELTIIVGKAMTIALNKRGIDIGRINYQDNGNWTVFKPRGPQIHIHLYGRAKSAKIQKYGDATYFPHRETGFYDGYEPLNEGDIKEIKKEIDLIMENNSKRI